MSETESASRSSTAQVESEVIESRLLSVEPGVAVRLNYLKVEDVSDETPELRSALAAIGDELDQELRARPDLRAPDFTSMNFLTNSAAAWLYLDADPVFEALPPDTGTMREWGATHLPTASALGLFPLQRLDEAARVMPSGRADERSRVLFTNMIDGIALRSRAAIFAQHVRRRASQVQGRMHLLSLGSGAAVPVLDALATIDEDTDATRDLVLVDRDAKALALAVELAAEAGLSDQVRVLNDNIVRSGRHLPRHHFHLVDLLGVWEYGSDRACASLIRTALARLAPGGQIIVSNMLLSRPQLHLNQRGVGWPAVVPRTVEQMIGIALSSGVTPNDIEISVPEDGVYAVMAINA